MYLRRLTVSLQAVFKTAALNRSATLPMPYRAWLLALTVQRPNRTAATALLPFQFRGLVYGRPERGVNLRRRVLLHPRQHVAVKIERDADARMPEPLLRDLRMDAARQ